MSFLSKFRNPWSLRDARVDARCLRCTHGQRQHHGPTRKGHCRFRACHCRRFRSQWTKYECIPPTGEGAVPWKAQEEK